MLFDKSKVYSAVNADELRPGDKVIVANSIGYIKDCLRKDDYVVDELIDVLGEFEQERFGVGEIIKYFSLAYLVEREVSCTNCAKHERCGRIPNVSKFAYRNKCSDHESKTEQKVEKQYRPFVNTDELIKVWCEKGGKWQKRELTLPYIWVRKTDCGSELLITGYNKPDSEVFIGDAIDLRQLFDDYTFLDGSPCGVEE